MFEFMYKGLKKALEGCDQVEFYGERSDILSIDLEREEVKKMKRVRGMGIGVRVVIEKKIGFSYTTAVEDRKIEECVAHAMKQARVSEQDEHFTGLPTPVRSYKKPAKTIDKEIIDLLRSDEGSEVAIEYCTGMLDGMKEYELRGEIECRPTEGSFAAALDETFIINSEGIEASDVGTYVSAGITVVASDGTEEVPGYESDVRRMLADLQVRWIGREAVRIAAESLGGGSLQTKKMPVVFSPRALQSLFAYTLIPQLSAENVQRKQSPYHGKKGEVIAPEMLTIVDDGTMPAGVNSRRMDGEGVPSQSTTLIEGGVLKTFLYDSYTAGKDQVSSTGNAVRSFDNLPAPGSTNFILKGRGSAASRDELFTEIREGLFVTDVIGAHTASRASGDFSVVAQNAFRIRKGDLFPIKHAMITGNMQDLLMHIELLGSDMRQIYNLVSPSLMVSELQVIS